MSGIYPREGDHRNAPHNALLVSRHIVIRGDPIGPLDIGRTAARGRASLCCKSVNADRGLVRHLPALPFCGRGAAGERGNRDETASGMNGSN